MNASFTKNLYISTDLSSVLCLSFFAKRIEKEGKEKERRRTLPYKEELVLHHQKG
jgi:hypothetical protein